MKIKLRIVKGGACDYSKTYCKNVNIRWSLSKWNDRLFIGFRLTKKLKL